MLAFIALAGASCRHAPGTAPPGACPQYVDEKVAGAAVLRSDDRPSWVLVPREGDPQGAVGVVVVTGGTSYASTALSAVLEARLQKSGFPGVDARADRDSFRLRALVDTPERAIEFERAVQKALVSPVGAGAAELALVSRRVAALKRHPLEAPVASSVARCTGELGLLAGEPSPEPSSPEGIAAIESARAASYGAQRVAFGVVGSASLVDGVSDSWKSLETWPKGSPPETMSSGDEDVGAYAAAGRAGSPARVTVALAHRDAEQALESALRAGAPEGPLVARLRSLTVPFRVVEATGTARPHGGCAAVSLEALRAAPPGAIEESAAIAAAIARSVRKGAARCGRRATLARRPNAPPCGRSANRRTSPNARPSPSHSRRRRTLARRKLSPRRSRRARRSFRRRSSACRRLGRRRCSSIESGSSEGRERCGSCSRAHAESWRKAKRTRA
jgi:hypothetical protein